MAPLVIAQDPDLTDSEEEKKEIPKSTESVQEENSQLIIPVPSSAEKSTVFHHTVASASENIQQTAVNEQTNPWDGPPDEEPVYPPGTYRGIF